MKGFNQISRRHITLTLAALAAVFAMTLSAQAASITLTDVGGGVFNNPIGIDYHSTTNSVIFSANYSNGLPYNFERIDALGNVTQFSTISGLSEEVKIATTRSNAGGFGAGTLFTGTGVNGQILRINSDGTVNSTINLPGGDGLMRGSLYHDRTGVYGNDLVAVTTGGQIWRVDSAGTGTLLADVNTHLEGLLVVPNNVATWGTFAGNIIAGAENSGLLYAYNPNTGAVTNHNVSVNIEDIDLIDANENFFGVNFGTGKILGANASDFSTLVGDILLTQETLSGTTGLFSMSYNGTNLVTQQILNNGISPGQWEHVTFAPAGLGEIPEIPNGIPTPAAAFAGLLGFAFVGILRRTRKI